ncbi:unnamed protein product [Porites lobata]|uniref:WAP domain-containing protein n=1 Tax=Porites lobata TaxID=104759 RepID=A0ABN8R8F3_9CNID|nr:unnamed protein product [Porites lobata]
MQRIVAFVLLICILYFVDNIPPGRSTPVRGGSDKRGICPAAGELKPIDHQNTLPCGLFCTSDSDCGPNNPLKCCFSGCGWLCKLPDCSPVMRSFGMILNKITDPRSSRSWCIK